MLDSIRVYGRYVSISIRSQMQYKASFIMMATGQLLITAIEFFGLWALFARFGSLRGWTLAEVALFYGMINVAFAVAEAVARGFDTVPAMVKSGEFDRLLLRPRTTILQVAAGELQLMRVGRLVQGMVVLLWAAAALDVTWTMQKVVLAVATMLAGTCMFYGLFVLQATVAFWTIESLEIMNTVTYGGVETAQYPLVIYRPWFRRFFIFVVPLACVSYFPVLAILGRPDPLGAPIALQWIAPVGGFVFFLLSLQVWKIGVRHYRSTGS